MRSIKRLSWTAAIVAVALTAFSHASTRAQSSSARVIHYFITDGDTGTGFRNSDRELARWAFEAWARNADGAFRVEPASLQEEALIRVYWAPADGSRYGETHPIYVAGERGAAVFVAPDVDALGLAIASRAKQDPLWRESIVYLTCLHEIGHALGLVHTANERDVMYFFGYGGDVLEFFGRYRRQLKTRADITRVSGLSDGDIAALHAAQPAR